jgi:hypothetical protein
MSLHGPFLFLAGRNSQRALEFDHGVIGVFQDVRVAHLDLDVAPLLGDHVE